MPGFGRLTVFSALKLTLSLVLLSLTPSRPSSAAGVTSALQQATRAATFEVVLAKQENPAIIYEKALPWELIPYQERTDKYWSIGTAFAIGPNTFVSAGHVLLAGVGSALGDPALRAADGKVYAIDQIQKFSVDEDFMVFSLRTPPDITPLQINDHPQIDDDVLAVGNALGDGIVIRSGLYTSATPEDQDGRWKWIRFSAAASPGNSGGPLLDAQGRVIGIVIAKSENENLNYALPITQALNAPDKQARFDTRSQFALPIFNQPLTQTLTTQFALPKSFSDFARDYRQLQLKHYNQSINALLQQRQDILFPHGKGVNKLLASQGVEYFPVVMLQNSNDEWVIQHATDLVRHDLPGDGFISTGELNELNLLRLHRPNKASDNGFYTDSKQFMDLLLSGLRISRTVGSENVRVTSLGKAQLDEIVTDRFNRVWQLRSWPVTYMDSQLVAMLLPTPEGYVGLMKLVNNSTYDTTLSELQQLTHFVQASYWGTLPQWQAFMTRKTLLPKTLAESKLSFSHDAGLQFKSHRLDVTIPALTLPLSDAANMGVTMQYIVNANTVVLDSVGLNLSTDDNDKTNLSWLRKIAPDTEAGHELLETWHNMSALETPYNSFPRFDSSSRSYWISTTLGLPVSSASGDTTRGMAVRDDNAKVRYLVQYRTENQVTSGEVSDTLRRVLQGTRILER